MTKLRKLLLLRKTDQILTFLHTFGAQLKCIRMDTRSKPELYISDTRNQFYIYILREKGAGTAHSLLFIPWHTTAIHFHSHVFTKPRRAAFSERLLICTIMHGARAKHKKLASAIAQDRM